MVDLESPAALRRIEDFFRRHDESFKLAYRRQSQLLEIGSIAAVGTHYRAAGYKVAVEHPGQDGSFRLKLSTRGHPRNFSSFLATKGRSRVEIHGNLLVAGHTRLPDAFAGYTLDVAVIRQGALPERAKGPTPAVASDALVTFCEAKKLVVYPMLLAQFVGIVHEVAPGFLERRPWGFLRDGHFDPALVAVGPVSSGSAAILGGFARRGYRICIVSNFEQRIAAAARDGNGVSVFRPLEHRWWLGA